MGRVWKKPYGSLKRQPKAAVDAPGVVGYNTKVNISKEWRINCFPCSFFYIRIHHFDPTDLYFFPIYSYLAAEEELNEITEVHEI